MSTPTTTPRYVPVHFIVRYEHDEWLGSDGAAGDIAIALDDTVLPHAQPEVAARAVRNALWAATSVLLDVNDDVAATVEVTVLDTTVTLDLRSGEVVK